MCSSIGTRTFCSRTKRLDGEDKIKKQIINRPDDVSITPKSVVFVSFFFSEAQSGGHNITICLYSTVVLHFLAHDDYHGDFQLGLDCTLKFKRFSTCGSSRRSFVLFRNYNKRDSRVPSHSEIPELSLPSVISYVCDVGLSIYKIAT